MKNQPTNRAITVNDVVYEVLEDEFAAHVAEIRNGALNRSAANDTIEFFFELGAYSAAFVASPGFKKGIVEKLFSPTSKDEYTALVVSLTAAIRTKLEFAISANFDITLMSFINTIYENNSEFLNGTQWDSFAKNSIDHTKKQTVTIFDILAVMVIYNRPIAKIIAELALNKEE